MNSKRVSFLLLILAACGGPDPEAAPPAEETVDPNARDLNCSIEDDELRVSVLFSHGGSTLEHCSTSADASGTEVRVRITSPPPGAAVTTAFEHKEVRVPLHGAEGPIRVRLQQRVREKQYVSEPPFVLARMLRR